MQHLLSMPLPEAFLDPAFGIAHRINTVMTLKAAASIIRLSQVVGSRRVGEDMTVICRFSVRPNQQ